VAKHSKNNDIRILGWKLKGKVLLLLFVHQYPLPRIGATCT